MEITFEMEKVTKNTVRFAEVLESDFAAPKIGSIYIPKSTLGELGWDGESKIKVEVKVG